MRSCAALGLGLLLSLSALEPAAAKSCDREEPKRLRELERARARCGGDAACEDAAEQKCLATLSRFGCDWSGCLELVGGPAPGDQCAFSTVEGATTAIDKLLADEVLPELNAEWPQEAADKGLDPYSETDKRSSTVADGCSKGGDLGDVVCGVQAAECTEVYAEYRIESITGLAELHFDSLAVESLTSQDLSSFTVGGPDASRIMDGGGPLPANSAWNSPRAVVLPTTGPATSIVVDLGDTYTLCSPTSCFAQPSLLIQRSADDTYALDASVDGHTWTPWGVVPPQCSTCNGLYYETLFFDASPQARYVRVYATGTSGSATQYSVSFLQVLADGGINSQGRPARGPTSKITTTPFPNSGAAYNDPLATVLPNEGPASALTLDFGRVVYARTAQNDTGFGLQRLVSGNDQYRLEYSSDGLTWTLWADLPPICGSCSQLEQALSFPPTVAGRYFRIYHPAGTTGDGHYSVGFVKFIYSLTPTGTTEGNSNIPVRGPESLATNAEFAPAGTAYNDARYSVVLANTGPSYALHVDLGKSTGRGITRVKVQADANDTYTVLLSSDGINWKTLYDALPVSGSGLQTRDSGDGLVDPSTGRAWVGRYVAVWAISGDGKYGVSEVEIFNDQLASGCPFDPDANAIALGSAQCSYSGTLGVAAALPGDDTLDVDVDDIQVYVRCYDGFAHFTEPLFPPAGQGPTSESCTVPTLSLSADADFCALQCASSTSQPSFETTYMGVESVSPVLPDPPCDLGDLGAPDDLADAVSEAIGADVIAAATAALQSTQNALLSREDFRPFPGETLPGGDPAVCSSP